jgi:hypothetical protein
VSTLAKEIEEENFNKEDLHFGKSGLGFLIFLSHFFSQGGGAARVRERRRGRTCGICTGCTVGVFGSSRRYSPPGQLFVEMKMPRSQRITIEHIKEASEEIRRS